MDTENKDTAEKIKEIRNSCRLAMNGPASQAMRERGLEYRLNFGVEYPRIKQIAAPYGKDHDLAQALWKEDVREMKIMAGIIQPADTFIKELAEIWMDSIRQQELAEMTSMNLFSKLPYASEIAFEWIAAENNACKQYCGYLILARLLASGKEMNERSADEFLDQAESDALSDEYLPKAGAMTALKKFVSQNEDNAKRIEHLIGKYKGSAKQNESDFYNEMKFELDFTRQQPMQES